MIRKTKLHNKSQSPEILHIFLDIIKSDQIQGQKRSDSGIKTIRFRIKAIRFRDKEEIVEWK
jgi:hypothetical protein